MKKIINKSKFSQWLTVITLSVVISTLNIIHVIIGLAKTPSGFTYLATGHYYLDYFEYLQHIAAGIAGRWMPVNYFTTDFSPVDWRFVPYILIGKIAWVFHLSPVTAYWVSIFFITLFTLIGFYYLIDLMLQNEAFYLKIIAFLLTVFSGPFYQIFIKNDQLVLNPFDFWYGPAAFIRRFEAIPYHALGLLLLLIIIVFVNKIWKNIHNISFKLLLINSFWISLLSVALMTFSPLTLASLIPALLMISGIYFVKLKNDRLKILVFNGILLLSTIPAALILRRNIGYGGISFELNWISQDPWWFILLNLGPIVLFFPFGIKEYLKENNFLRLFLLIFTLVSFVLFISPAAYYLGTHNLRFFSSIAYVFYGVLTVIAIKKISLFFNSKSKIIILLISLLLIFYSSFLTFYTIYKRTSGLDPTTPQTIWTYLPSPIIKGLELLQDYPSGNVLVGPYGGIGMFIPTFSYKKVYVSHPAGAPDFDKKQSTVYLFFSGKMSNEEAVKFLNENGISFVILTSYDNFDPRIINNYSFLKEIFVKPSIIIWKVI